MKAVYYHYWIPDDWRSLFWYWQLDEQCRLLEQSGLTKNAYINCFITMPVYWSNDVRGMPFHAAGTRNPILFHEKVREYIEFRYPYINLSFRDTGLVNIYEGATLRELHGDSLLFANETPHDVLYIHNKGISSAGPNAKLWFDSLNRTLITGWEKCVESLNAGNNVVGVRDNTVRFDERGLTHVSGNMFWSKMSYIVKLDDPLYDDRYEYERWITSGDKEGKKVDYILDLKADPFIDYCI